MKKLVLIPILLVSLFCSTNSSATFTVAGDPHATPLSGGYGYLRCYSSSGICCNINPLLGQVDFWYNGHHIFGNINMPTYEENPEEGITAQMEIYGMHE